MRPLPYRANRLPSGRPVRCMTWVWACPHDEYEMSYAAEEAAYVGAVVHCRTSGGKAHDALLVDLLAARSPLFAEWVGSMA